MNGVNNWLEGWKAVAEYRRQSFAQALSRKPVSPAAREFYVKAAESLVNNQKRRAEAYREFHSNGVGAYVAHLKNLSQMLSKATSGTPGSSTDTTASSKGSLGDGG